MSSWGHRQQVKYVSIFVIIVALLFGSIVYFGFFNKKPTCFDGVQNGDETGIDCGGSCQQVCPADELDPLVQYTRVFQVDQGLYSVLAMVENPNSRLLAEDVPYTFKVFDKDGVVIAERHGMVFIPPHKIFPIFEGTLKTGIRVPVKMSFQFDQPPVWRRAAATEPTLTVTDENLNASTSFARLDANLRNANPYDFSHIEAVALLYDDTNNVFAASETIIDSLPRRSQVPLVFTWPKPLLASSSKIEVITNIPYQDFIPNK
jgi:hypothetical protein